MKSVSNISWYGRPVKGIVFDLDGTLTDSMEAYYLIFHEALAEVGIHVEKEDVLGPMADGTLIWDRAIPKDIPHREERLKHCMNAVPRIFKEMMQRVNLFPGVESVCEFLTTRDIALGILTDSWKLALQPLYRNSLSASFKAIVTREDGFPRKPSPLGVLECLKRMEVDPQHAITVGDSVLDMRAGSEAGTLTVAVATGVASRLQLENEMPTALIDDLRHLLSVLIPEPDVKCS